MIMRPEIFFKASREWGFVVLLKRNQALHLFHSSDILSGVFFNEILSFSNHQASIDVRS